MTKTSTISVERIRQVVSYDPDTGIFTWLPRSVPRFDNRFAGKRAGTMNSCGYLQITVDHVTFVLHRLAFVLMEGSWPPDLVDHINGNRSDNRWANLRHADVFQNAQNQKAGRNRLGIRGVYTTVAGKPYEVSIMAHGKYRYLGTYDTIEEAIAARQKAALELHKDFARLE